MGISMEKEPKKKSSEKKPYDVPSVNPISLYDSNVAKVSIIKLSQKKISTDRSSIYGIPIFVLIFFYASKIRHKDFRPSSVRV